MLSLSVDETLELQEAIDQWTSGSLDQERFEQLLPQTIKNIKFNIEKRLFRGLRFESVELLNEFLSNERYCSNSVFSVSGNVEIAEDFATPGHPRSDSEGLCGVLIEIFPLSEDIFLDLSVNPFSAFCGIEEEEALLKSGYYRFKVLKIINFLV